MKNMKKKSVLMLAAMVLLLTFAVGGTIAYLITSAGPVTNTFEPAKVTSAVNEPGWTNGDSLKQNVTISNTGNTSAYIRAAIVVTWKDADNCTMSEKPTTGDYSLVIGSDWVKDGDYYYYKNGVPAGKPTTNLIVSCSPSKYYADERKLCVEVIGSAIQSSGIPGETYLNAWSNAVINP